MNTTPENGSAVADHIKEHANVFETFSAEKQAELDKAHDALKAKEAVEKEKVTEALTQVDVLLAESDPANPDAILTILENALNAEASPTPEVPAPPAPPAPPEATPAEPEAEAAPSKPELDPRLAEAVKDLSESARERLITAYKGIQKLLEKPPYPRIMDDLSGDNIKAGMIRLNLTLISATMDLKPIKTLFDSQTQTDMKELLGLSFEETKGGASKLKFDAQTINEARLAQSMGISLEEYQNASKPSLDEVADKPTKIKGALRTALSVDMAQILKKDPSFYTEWSKAKNPNELLTQKWVALAEADKAASVKDSPFAKPPAMQALLKQYSGHPSLNPDDADIKAMLVGLDEKQFSDPSLKQSISDAKKPIAEPSKA